MANLSGLVRLTFRRPREAAQVVMRQPLPMQARWAALALMAVMSAFLMQGMAALLPPAVAPDGTELQPVGPFFWAGMVAFGMLMTAVLAFVVGRWRGGKGELADSVILIAWLQFIQLLLVVLQLVLLVALPIAAPLVEIGSLVIFLWLLVNFVAEMHGFRSLGLVFLGVIITFVVAVFALSLLMVSLGLGINV
ncbi:Yip1 family protein [Tabrizicola sp. M-4]|uniref:Yip1 family protein n=1 Tax=Tabrizicola sp. M-4 TaxID=3055847 RepID=UPI003DA7E04A